MSYQPGVYRGRIVVEARQYDTRIVIYRMPSKAKVGETFVIDGELQYKDSLGVWRGLERQRVYVEVSGIGVVASAYTSQGGEFKIGVKINKAGTYTVRIGYGGTSRYKPCTTTKTITIETPAFPTKIKIFKIPSKVGVDEPFEITGKLVYVKAGREYGLGGQRLNISISGIGSVANPATAQTGDFRASGLKISKPGTYTITISYPGK